MRERHCCLIDTNEGGMMNTPTLQGSTSASSRTARDTSDKGRKGLLPDFAE